MCTIKEIVAHKQPEVLSRLEAIRNRKQTGPGEVKINNSLARQLMRHDSYIRSKGGAIKQRNNYIT